MNQFKLVDSSCYGVLNVEVKVRMGHNGFEKDILDVTKENSCSEYIRLLGQAYSFDISWCNASTTRWAKHE